MWIDQITEPPTRTTTNGTPNKIVIPPPMFAPETAAVITRSATPMTAPATVTATIAGHHRLSSHPEHAAATTATDAMITTMMAAIPTARSIDGSITGGWIR